MDYEIPENGVAWFIPDDGLQAAYESGEAGGMDGKGYLWLPLGFWPDEGDDPGDAEPEMGTAHGEGPDGGRQEFDAWFEAARGDIQRRLGVPVDSGRYEYRHRKGWPYSYAAWRGERGFLVLQQDERDIQFGFDLSIWVLSDRDGLGLPSFPLGDKAS